MTGYDSIRSKRSSGGRQEQEVADERTQQIVRMARSKRADLIVVGTHGRRGFSKFFLGSVSERVIATASCPFMTVRGKWPSQTSGIGRFEWASTLGHHGYSLESATFRGVVPPSRT
jgi:hypothetical protein